MKDYNNRIGQLASDAYQNSVDHGFHEGPQNIGEKLMLIVSELGEALEAHRTGEGITPNDVLQRILEVQDNKEFEVSFVALVKDSFGDEMADVVIRVFDLCGMMGIDIEGHILAKHRYNTMRPFRHGNKKY